VPVLDDALLLAVLPVMTPVEAISMHAASVGAACVLVSRKPNRLMGVRQCVDVEDRLEYLAAAQPHYCCVAADEAAGVGGGRGYDTHGTRVLWAKCAGDAGAECAGCHSRR
jgi:hypothetical protein